MLKASLKESVRLRALSLGACACGFAVAEPVDAATQEHYQQWLARGGNASMDYCARYADVRSDPRLLLEGARTVICFAFAYPETQGDIASYALGLDYHYVIKDKLSQLSAFIKEQWGGECRAVVDSAPMHERYWAVKAGIGFIGVNRLLIVPGAGTYVLLGELLWTGAIEPDEPCELSCYQCMACVKACPGGALDGCGNFDASRCVSYLTIEHRGDLPPDANLAGSIYGCDQCQRICPHNSGNPRPSVLPEFMPRAEVCDLSRDEILTMTPSHYKKLVAHSAMRRVPLAQLQRNVRHDS